MLKYFLLLFSIFVVSCVSPSDPQRNVANTAASTFNFCFTPLYYDGKAKDGYPMGKLLSSNTYETFCSLSGEGSDSFSQFLSEKRLGKCYEKFKRFSSNPSEVSKGQRVLNLRKTIYAKAISGPENTPIQGGIANYKEDQKIKFVVDLPYTVSEDGKRSLHHSFRRKNNLVHVTDPWLVLSHNSGSESECDFSHILNSFEKFVGERNTDSRLYLPWDEQTQDSKGSSVH